MSWFYRFYRGKVASWSDRNHHSEELSESMKITLIIAFILLCRISVGQTSDSLSNLVPVTKESMGNGNKKALTLSKRNNVVVYNQFDKEGRKTGKWITVDWFEGDSLKSIDNYAFGELDGEAVTYYSNGQIEVTTFFKNGKKEGISRYYYKDGRIDDTWIFKNDSTKFHFKSGGGILYESYCGKFIMYQKGKPTGPSSKIKYNKKEGIEKVFNKDGTISEIYIRSNGLTIYHVKFIGLELFSETFEGKTVKYKKGKPIGASSKTK